MHRKSIGLIFLVLVSCISLVLLVKAVSMVAQRATSPSSGFAKSVVLPNFIQPLNVPPGKNDCGLYVALSIYSALGRPINKTDYDIVSVALNPNQSGVSTTVMHMELPSR